MVVKAGDIVQVGNNVLFDRIQTGGPGQLNIPTDKIYEVGNYSAVGTVLDTPDLSYSLESFDASAEMESLLVGKDFSTDTDGTEYQLSTCLPMDVAGQFKRGKLDADKYEAPFSVAAPYLVCESVSYKFGLKDNASQSVGLKGDSLFYNPGSTYIQNATGSGVAGQEIVLTHDAYPYEGDTAAGTRYALSVSLVSGQRLRHGVDYTENATGAGDAKSVTITVVDAVDVTDAVRVVYSSDTVASYTQDMHALASTTRPAAIRGRDILVYIAGTIWTGVQSVGVDFKLQIEKDEEFGNQQVVGQDFDVPATTGSITIKPRSFTDLMTKLRALTGVTSDTEVIGSLQRLEVPIEIVLLSPTDGSILKTLYVPDAKFTIPGFSGKVQSKLTFDINFESESGELYVYKGHRDTAPVTAPTTVAGTNGGTLSSTVSWLAPTDDGGSAITSYKIYKYKAGIIDGSPVTSSGSGLSKNVTGLLAGTAYTFKVSAVNAKGEGPLSDMSAAATTAA